MPSALVVLDQRMPRGGGHYDSTPPLRVDVRHARTHPRSCECFLICLRAVALLIIIYRQPRVQFTSSFRNHGDTRICCRIEEAPRPGSFHLRHRIWFSNPVFHLRRQDMRGICGYIKVHESSRMICVQTTAYPNRYLAAL